MTNKLPLRADHVGSLLRTQAIKDARIKHASGEITDEELTKIENSEIEKIISKQAELGFSVVTDGEFRRAWYYLDFFTACEGIDVVESDPLVFNNNTETDAINFSITGKIKLGKHRFIDEFKATNEIAKKYGVEVKLTIPSPNLITYRDVTETEREFYNNEEEVFDDIIKMYKELIPQLYEAGCRHLQFDDTAWNSFFTDFGLLEVKGIDRELALKLFKYATNETLSAAPDDMKTYVHICRGNYKSEHLTEGSYGPIAETLFGQLDYDYLMVEYDDERSGDFEPLKYATKENQIITLGLLSSKTGELEDIDSITNRIHEAAKYVPLDRLALSPQCGFASTEEGNVLTEEEQWNKLKHVINIVDQVWDRMQP
ncbi:5-methyltetrahydropteroyltriglutamate--homocysteine S-methyltransferase [Oceanobacillus piezotolerans]|uniref:5-methyltetrahydropteroyltriglutamate--homocysteine S-methyltransferase n=1 Tax=Oceanobacillus piezotolerans TaxID=2448030 RepID=A0A498D811_9BACI|nr:5-methyltetrahydropteroyltriglutamate--homocysteine S-methyltransferase [Oceanobacillus piezotolerans]RLL43928.1 5-methyltetrahydropteroyltriglutamate--homocysteine S-methyltransferase [Oceanobacillus piezotolerans]